MGGGFVITDFIVTGQVQSRNVLDKMHWAKRANLAAAWHFRVLNAVGGRPFAKPLVKRKVRLTVYRNRELDSDNLIGGAKALRDALVKVGLLVDDKPKWAEFDYRTGKCPEGREHVRVMVGDMDDDFEAVVPAGLPAS